ncbi:class II aldolase/adducin family protein [Nocardioides sp. L-11A]|uniref:class II aldolase/adducin family protein n=1 Tax=Nocardioides sp. L-11A TaxID=3043848 RepID=UPI00249CC4A3|nr:class II aldolase/adducin family protein [Nocardioides sp. L-11A]
MSLGVHEAFEMRTGSVQETTPRTAEEQQVRTDLAAAYQLCAMFGWDDLIYTHLSARVPGSDHHYLVNPLGLAFDEITASNLIKIDLDGNIIGDNPHGFRPNYAGFVIHGGIHSAREDAGCIMHLHTEAQMALSCLATGLLPLTQHAMRFHGRVGYHAYEGIALSEDERLRFIADLADHAVLILNNHGSLTVGRTVAQAFVEMYYLEKSARTQLLAQATGQTLVIPDDAVVDLTAQQWSGALSAGLEWPSLLRRLDRAESVYAS